MIHFITNNLFWSQGSFILIILLSLMIAGWYFSKILFIISILTFIFCLYFFRNPERICKEALTYPTILISPADGTIVSIDYDENNKFDGYAKKISIFLSPFNVHVNWIPMAGTISNIQYKPGSFLPAFLPKSSELNERNDIIIIDEKDRSILVRQIAGTLARRIACWIKKGQEVAPGQKYGMIKFSSRVDLFVPRNVSIEVGVGQQVYGGQTVIGKWQ
jgi:phosphatidylserine decarboxylase